YYLSQCAAEQGHQMLNGLKELEDHSFVGDVRGFGLMDGIEIVENKDTKEPGSNERVGKLIADSKQRGLIIGKNGDTVEGYNNIITLCPPLSSTDEDIDFILTTLKDVFENNA